MTSPTKRATLLATGIAMATVFAAPPAAAQDEVWEHQQRVGAQQAEERRMNDIILGMDEDGGGQQGASGQSGDAPNSFVSYPPEAWADWLKHSEDSHRRDEEERTAKDPAYQALAQGTWTYRGADAKGALQACEATFWTRNGGVSFIHLGGNVDLTLLGFFGAGIPSVKRPRTVTMELIQSGEAQKVRALNLHFGSVASMGMVLFNVHSPKILIDAIEDRQDFEIRLDGKTIAQGEWHSGLAARDQLAACLARHGVRP